MADVKRLREIAFKALGACTPDEIQKVLDDGAKQVAGKIWRGTAAAMACGFGKGILAMAIAIVIGGALISGIGAYGGAAGLIGMTFNEGLVAGAVGGFKSLMTGGGALALALGGVMGSVMDTRRAQERITAETAQVQAAAYEVLRSRGQELQRGGADSIIETMPQINFAAQEMERRNQAATGMAK